MPKDLKITETFNFFFLNIVKETNISLGKQLLSEKDHIEDQVLRIIKRFKINPSVVAIFESHKDNLIPLVLNMLIKLPKK